jgi:hypothetical protein
MPPAALATCTAAEPERREENAAVSTDPTRGTRESFARLAEHDEPITSEKKFGMQSARTTNLSVAYLELEDLGHVYREYDEAMDTTRQWPHTTRTTPPAIQHRPRSKP